MPNPITKAELARRLGISKASVSQYCGMGMPLLRDGSVDFDKAKRWLADNVLDHRTYQPWRHHQKVAQVARPARLNGSAQRGQASDISAPPAPEIDIREAQRRDAVARMHEREMNLAKLRGELVSREAIVGCFTQLVMRCRTRLMAIPTKAAPRVVGKRAGEVEALLSAYIREALEEIADTKVIVAAQGSEHAPAGD